MYYMVVVSCCCCSLVAATAQDLMGLVDLAKAPVWVRLEMLQSLVKRDSIKLRVRTPTPLNISFGLFSGGGSYSRCPNRLVLTAHSTPPAPPAHTFLSALPDTINWPGTP